MSDHPNLYVVGTAHGGILRGEPTTDRAEAEREAAEYRKHGVATGHETAMVVAYVPESRRADAERERDEALSTQVAATRELDRVAQARDAAIARAEKAEAFIESLSTGRAGTANRCTGIACTDPDYGDIACMRLANHAGEHVALFGDALAYDLAEALAKVEHLKRELSASRHDANLALAAARAHDRARRAKGG